VHEHLLSLVQGQKPVSHAILNFSELGGIFARLLDATIQRELNFQAITAN
jgi:hypothetical protein